MVNQTFSIRVVRSETKSKIKKVQAYLICCKNSLSRYAEKRTGDSINLVYLSLMRRLVEKRRDESSGRNQALHPEQGLR